MEQKIYDEALGGWVVVGTSNASSLEVVNPGFVDETGGSVSANNALTKLDNRVTRAEQNILWLAHNKGEGGGGGGSGGGETYTIEILDGNVIYTSSSSAIVDIMINSAGVKKSFTVTAKNLDTNKIIGTWKRYSMSKTDINFTDLSDTTNIELTAYDANNKYTTPVYFKIIAGAIKLEIQKIPPKTMYIGGINEVPLNFTVTNNIEKTAAEFKLLINNIEVVKETGIVTPIRSLLYDARKLLFNSEHFNPKAGQKFVFKASASTVLNGEILNSEVITFDITVADSNNLIIVTEDITEFSPSDTIGETINDLTKYSQGSQLAFSYYFSCGLTAYYTFNMNYSIDLMQVIDNPNYVPEGPEPAKIIELVKNVYIGEVKNINKGENNRFSYSTVNLDVTLPNQFIKLTLSGYAVNDPGDVNAQYTKTVTCTITEAKTVELYANNDMHTLLSYFSRVTGFPNTPTGTWNYPLRTSGQFIYEGAFINKFPNGVNLTLEKVNGKTSGFLVDSDGINSVPAIRLTGESYGYLEVAEQMFPQLEISSGVSFFQSSGFCISTTFLADTTSNPNETVLSIASYDNDGNLKTGYEITVEQVTCKIGSADTLICKLPQNELLTVDLDVSLLSGTGWYFKIYLNGVLSAVTRVSESDIDWMFGTNLYLGCRYDKGITSRFSNVTFYDVKLYTSSQSEYAIVQNYISSTCQSLLKKGQVDPEIDANLRIKNLFDSEGNCLIWDKTANNGKGEFLHGDRLYNKLIEQMEINTPYPVVLVEETSNAWTLFEPFSTAIFSADDKHNVMDKTFPCKITYQDAKGKALIRTPSGVSDELGVRIGLQGTSSLSYNSKNYEIYMGYKDAEGNPLLFQPKDEWLPENQFTLKADVMDSAHVNNVVIGQIVNGHATNDTGQKITPFTATPPMALGNEVWGGDIEKANAIRSKFKHTSEGFPVLLFIKFAPDKDGNTQQSRFMGIYNFNLGRHAYHNLGMRLLIDYVKETPDGPSVVSEYSVNNTYWNKPTGEGVYSLEINQNSSAQGAFQQDALPIIKFMGDVTYTSKDESTAYNQAQKFYTQVANMALTKIQKYTMTDTNPPTPTKPIPGQFYDLDKNAYYNFAASDKHLNWNNTLAYFNIAILFGMVDSMCKNLTIRNWGTDEWYTCFYDMDTAFGLNNAGQDIVAYWAHLHRWFNINTADTNMTTYTLEKNYVSNDQVKQYYASWWNRLWEIIENLSGIDSGATGSRESIETVYTNLRTNLFPNPDKFIDKYYKGYTEATGSIMFNYDYQIKYLKLSKKYNINTGEYEDYTDFSQLKFLHGNRVMHVRDWFRKRVLFLDGIYGIKNNEVLLPINVESPINTMWASNKVTGSKVETQFGTKMQGVSKVLYRYAMDKTTGSFWIDENLQTAVVPVPGGETILYMYANKYITEFDKFKSYNWTNLDNIDLPLLETMDLSGLTNVDAGYFFIGGVFDPNANEGKGRGLKNIRNLTLNNVKLIGDKASAYTLDVSNCQKLQNLDISSSTITKVKLSDSAVLKTFNMSYTDITELNISNQAFLETLLINGCDKLRTIEISNCASLRTLEVPKNVQSIIIKNCPNLASISIPYISINNSISELKNIVIDNCQGLLSFNITGQNNPLLEIDLVGAWNLELLNVSQTKYARMTLPSLYVNNEPFFKSLKHLDISRTELYNLTFNDSVEDFLDLRAFPDLENISADLCKNLTIVKCQNNPENPITLNGYSFNGCVSLQRIYGNYELNGNDIFKECSSLILNTSNTYDRYGTNDFIPGDDVTNITFSDTVSNCIAVFESCSSLSYNDFKYIMVRMKSNILNIERMFQNCSNISGVLWYDMFRNLNNLNNIKNAFSSTQLSGIFFSSKKEFDINDKSTWGILDFVPKLKDAEEAFSSTNIEWIDNNLFAPKLINGVYTPTSLVKVTGMFRGCYLIKACEYTHDLNIVESELSSETFFLHLDNILDIYPKDVFNGCGNIKMRINEDSNGNTLLFHRKVKPSADLILDNSLYSGIQLFGEIKENIFGGITDKIGEYFIPDFTVIKNPLGSSGNNMNIDISKMDNIFSRINSKLRQAIGIFSGLNLIGTKKLPPNIFKGCVKLNNISNIFSNLKLDYKGEEFEFPIKGMFDDCVELQIISGILRNTNSYKIKLIGEQFKNCKLTDVSSAFESSGIYGIIPYRLFFMVKNNTINSSIESMSAVFKNCFYLGYDKSRSYDFSIELNEGQFTSWNDHIVLNKGNKVYYKLDVTKMEKSFNYDQDLNETILNPSYIADESFRPEGYDPNTPEFIPNPNYYPDEMAFDKWYLDGFGWEGAIAKNPLEQQDLDNLKKSLTDIYFKYDLEQKEVINIQNSLELYIPTNQHYMISTDFFRYCSNKCNLGNILSDLTWKENIIKEDLETGFRYVIMTNNDEGMTGRMPVKLLESLKDVTILNNVFENTKFDAFVGLNPTSGNYKRGIMYPPDLFKFNVNLISIKGMFMDTIIPVGVDINSDLFTNQLNLKNISYVWSNCIFDNREMNSNGVLEIYPQIDFVEMFKNNTKINDADNLFGVNKIDSPKGLLIIDKAFLKGCYSINNISSMFLNCTSLKGSVPEFSEVEYPYLRVVTGYLSGVIKQNITNADNLEQRLIPQEWLS